MKKKTILCTMAAAAMMMSGCGTQNSTLSQVGTAILTDVLTGGQGSGTAATGQAVGNILASVLGGAQKPTLKQLIGTWTYSQPGCAFTSDKLLAQAGGEVVASQVKAKLLPTYQKLGVSASNTKVTFNEDGTFSASFAGKSFSGNFTFDESTSQVVLQGMLLKINCYAKRNSDGIALLFESSKLLTLLQTMSALSGSTEAQAVGQIAGSYDGLRLGFDFK